jgi:hypothetical protein
VLRNATGTITIRKDNVLSRTSSGRSLMPEGFEQLGAENMRDLLAYLCGGENKFRVIDLTSAFTANSSRGIFGNPDDREDTVTFRKYGTLTVDSVPFDVISPNKAVANAVVLKGGANNGWSKQNLPKQVEAKVGVAATRLHFLGGVAGWGYPAVSEKVDTVKVTLHFADNTKQEIVLKNGVEIADYNGRPDVPGSKGQPELVRGRGQIRSFSKDVTGKAVIEKITLESYDNNVAPVFFAITAELPAAH